MKTTQAETIRAENLYRLVYEIHGGPTDFFNKFGYPRTPYIAQMIGPNKTRPVSEKVARKVEQIAALPDGWLDQKHSESQNTPSSDVINNSFVFDLMQKVGEESEKAGVSLGAKKTAEVVAFLYETAQLMNSKLSDGYIERFVRLFR